MAGALSGRRGLVTAVTSLLVGGTVALVVAQATWVHIASGGRGVSTKLDSGFHPAVELMVKGTEAVPAVVPLALLALAGVVGVIATRGLLRRVVGAVIAVCGTGLAAVGVLVLADPDRIVPSALGAQSLDPGLADTLTVSVTWVWPALVLLAGVLVTIGGTLAVGWSARWPAMGARYEAPTGAARSDRAVDAWTALDRGEDPTVQPPAPASPAPEREVPE
jgi:uncharacterized membrane protein (TIGR02234 family)